MKKIANWHSKEDMINEENIVPADELYFESEEEKVDEKNSISSGTRE